MIRQATPEDAAQVAPLFILSMGHIAGIFAGSETYTDAIPFFERYFSATANQYSYANTLVLEENGRILGAATGYDGARLHALRAQVLAEVRERDPSFEPGDETGAGEYYLDAISVREDAQGKGVGKQLLNAFITHAAELGFSKVGLIVEEGNEQAKRFYEKESFVQVGMRQFMGHRYFHMQRDAQDLK